MKTLFVILGILAVCIIGVFLFKIIPAGKSTFVSLFPLSSLNTLTKATATIKGNTIKLLLAKTSQEQRKGLSDRNSLPQDMGMLFTFNHPDYYLFWMRRMKFPLDIIYFNGNKVVTLLENVKNPPYTMENPPILKPQVPADKVLEVNAGLSKKYNLKVGDTITVNL